VERHLFGVGVGRWKELDGVWEIGCVQQIVYFSLLTRGVLGFNIDNQLSGGVFEVNGLRSGSTWNIFSAKHDRKKDTASSIFFHFSISFFVLSLGLRSVRVCFSSNYRPGFYEQHFMIMGKVV